MPWRACSDIFTSLLPVQQKIKVVDVSSMFVELRNEQVWIMCINTKEAHWQTNIKIYRFPESNTPEI